MLSSKVISVDDLPAAEAKWIALKKLTWHDLAGEERVWEYAEQKTRGSSGIDSKKNTTPMHMSRNIS